MSTYKHSVTLDIDKCKGCTNCLKRCPTEAIRIRNGHAVIDAERCIDCGECIRVCPYKAKKAFSDKLEQLRDYKWKVALPAPSLYGQFDNLDDIDYVLQGLLDYGFDDVYEVSRAAELVSGYTRRYLRREGIRRPVISSACPVVVRLISLRFPFLCDNVMPLLPPMEIAGMLAREQARERNPGLRDEDIGICFISPCPAKVSYVKNSFMGKKSNVDLVVSMNDVYFALLPLMKKDKTPMPISHSGMIGISWASAGGEASALFNDRYLAADGIENVIRVLDQIENGNMPSLEFIELNACSAGCVGGTMAVENPYIAKTNAAAVSARHAELVVQGKERRHLRAGGILQRRPAEIPADHTAGQRYGRRDAQDAGHRGDQRAAAAPRLRFVRLADLPRVRRGHRQRRSERKRMHRENARADPPFFGQRRARRKGA